MKDWPANEVTQRAVSDLILYARNSRTHSEQQVGQIAASIREWGWTVPVLIDDAGGIIAGHGRVLAAQKLGLTDIPCAVASGWSDAQRRAYVIADNKLALNAGWDEEMLRLELEDLRAEEFDIDLIGFSEEELREFDLMTEAATVPGEGDNAGSTASLADAFGIAPFSVLNAREGWWQTRKRAWLALGIKSELGRGEGDHHAAPGGSIMVAGYDKDGNRLTGLENIGARNRG